MSFGGSGAVGASGFVLGNAVGAKCGAGAGHETVSR